MHTKQPLLGAGIYYIKLHASKNQTLFQSVFEYENIKSRLASIENIQLLGFLFTPQTAELVLDCYSDWPEITDKLQNTFNDMHHNHWHKQQTIISEKITVFRVDERCLMPLIMQLHQLPVINKQVAEASMYAWSSDSLYRLSTPPKWINTHKMLKQLACAKRNQGDYYAKTILNTQFVEFDLQTGTDEQYAVIGKADFAEKVLAHQNQIEVAKQQADLVPIYQSALDYIATTYDISAQDIQDPTHRQYTKFMPLVVWLIQQSGDRKQRLAKLIGMDVEQIEYCQRIVPLNHSATLLSKMASRWVAPISLSAAKPVDDKSIPSPTTDESKI